MEKRQHYLPDVLTQDEIKTLLNATKNPNHHAIFMTVYSAGLRVSEVTHLTISDIDSQSRVICVRQGKEKKIVTFRYQHNCLRSCVIIVKLIDQLIVCFLGVMRYNLSHDMRYWMLLKV